MVKNVKDAYQINEILIKILGENPSLYINKKYIDYWPIASGVTLSAVTKLKSIKDGILLVTSTSSSAKALLKLKKIEIIEKYNKYFEELKIKDLKILKK